MPIWTVTHQRKSWSGSAAATTGSGCPAFPSATATITVAPPAMKKCGTCVAVGRPRPRSDLWLSPVLLAWLPLPALSCLAPARHATWNHPQWGFSSRWLSHSHGPSSWPTLTNQHLIESIDTATAANRGDPVWTWKKCNRLVFQFVIESLPTLQNFKLWKRNGLLVSFHKLLTKWKSYFGALQVLVVVQCSFYFLLQMFITCLRKLVMSRSSTSVWSLYNILQGEICFYIQFICISDERC